MKNAVVLTDEMIDAAYNHPDKVPDAAKRLMRDAVERVLCAGGYQVVDPSVTEDIDPYVVQEADAKHEMSEYGNWRWKMDRLSGLFGSQVLARRNVQFRPSPDRNNPDAVFVSNIMQERFYYLLTEWARTYFGRLNVGGGSRPNNTWWVRIDHKAMIDRDLAFPVETTSATVPEVLDPDVVFWQTLVGHSPLPAARWSWPVAFTIEYIAHSSADRVRVSCEDEGNDYALYNAACSILEVVPGDDSITRMPGCFVITRNSRQFINAMPETIRLKPGYAPREFEFSHAKQGARK